MMEREKRAKQFAPFDALTGLKEAIRLKEYEHNAKMKRDLSDDVIEKISNNLKKIEKKTIVRLKYYSEGHEYEYLGNIKLNIVDLIIELKDKVISFSDLLDLDIVA